ncbi:MAG: MMPL family transporter [Candidatus Heimdallarchaeota archaeon]|nr:MMPL family transporter [Candidatus Heimdallarchaeota archaeon]
MSKGTKKLKASPSRLKHIIVLIFWIAIIAGSAAMGAREALTEDVESATEMVLTESESMSGSELYEERFNITADDLTHIVIMQLPDDESFLSPQWRNYTFFLVQYLNDTLFDLGYDQFITESFLHLLAVYQDNPEMDAFGRSLVSDDENTALLNIVGTDMSFIDAEEILREHLETIHELLNVEDLEQEIYDRAEAYYNEIIAFMTFQGIPAQFHPPIDLYIHSVAEMKDKVEFIVTGTAANMLDTLDLANETFEQSEVYAVIVAVIILSIVFRSPLGILIPLIAMVASLLPAYLLTTWIAQTGLYGVSDFLPAIIGMIGIAVAIDYNLFSLVRFREEFRKRKAELLNKRRWDKEHIRLAQEEAAARTNKTTGQAVMYSGFTVIIGFSSLLVLGSDFTLGMAVGVSIAVAISILTARTLTPALLALFGNALDWPGIMSGANKQVEELRGQKKHKKTIWENWSKTVINKPLTFLFIGLLTMVPFVVLSFETDLGFDMVKMLPLGKESRDGFEIMQEEFDFGSINPMSIIIDLGEDTDFFAMDDETAINIIASLGELSDWALSMSEEREKDGTILEIDTFATFNTISMGKDQVITLDYQTLNDALFAVENLPSTDQIPAINQTTGFPITYPNGSLVMIENPYLPMYEQAMNMVNHMKGYINFEHGNNTIKIDMTTQLDTGSPQSMDLIDIIREKVKEIFNDGDNYKFGIVGIYTTGLSAIFLDGMNDMYADVPEMIVLAVALIFLALLILFRSIALPIKAIITISGSILFGLGSIVLVFQYGYFNLIEIFGVTLFEAEIVGLTYFLPAFLFTTILGLGMDYSILIISRIKEEYLRTGKMDESVGVGISKTAGVITSAALVMIATFLVFAGSPMIIMKIMGLAMAIAIFVDATISRIILLPAAMKLLGEYNWWIPKWLDKILPKIELEH